MKIIFLDIDGVLNNSETATRCHGAIGIDPFLVAIFNRIIFATDAKIVISSSWRHSKDGLDEIRKKVMSFIGITPTLPLSGGAETMERGKEIQTWIERHPEIKIEKYAILDDNSDFLPNQPLFQTTWEKGLTEEIASKVIDYLNN